MSAVEPRENEIEADGRKVEGPSGADTSTNSAMSVSDDGDDSTPEVRDLEAAADTAIDGDAISQEVQRAYDLVPAIGTRWRWYDFPYRVLRWLLTGWRRRLVPWRLRLRLNNGLNFFNVFNHYERLKVELRTSPLRNLVVPVDEEVAQGAIWVVEFFPPSFYDDLFRSLRKNGWGDNDFIGSIDGSNAEQIARARRRSSLRWSRLGTVANPTARYVAMDTHREVLPAEFDLIELSGVQIGSSMTAVIAFIQLSEQGQSSLNEVWKADHEPVFEWRGLRRPRTEDRYFSAIRATQRERQRLHDIARSWLSERCGGFFAQTEARQPVIDFNMFQQFDPTTSVASRDMGAPLRALAMETNYLFNYVSPQIPGAVLVRGEALRPPREALENCWGVVGSYKVVSDANDRPGYGDKPYSVGTLAAMVDDAVRAFLLHYAVVHYARQLDEQAATQRDTARSRHRSFSPRRLDALKHELLTFSVDLPAVARDTGQLWSPTWRRWEGLDVRGVPAPGIPSPPEEFDLIEQLGQSRTQLFESLISDDAAYREVLATTSSLGASAASARLGSRALFVSLASLFVSVTTLIAVNGSVAWSRIVEWLANF
ncbi:hypothetical protein [Rhodococcus sp. IEGM 1408]|uniref:hypothetical protein n=1 Tax=Rhodococcus sp. IEGM 1408 TaxID=3082220 RepID=UPI002953F75B|nr:hypothetical protein [Rhodococcus sp. IEGM 1408]MDV8002831.1 hypothetical protein [Rhodococcus sp. IEGM 1408]